MTAREVCPACEHTNTERVFVDWEQDAVFEVRICHDCEVQYENGFAGFEQEITVKA